VTLGLLLALHDAFPKLGEGVVALGMAVIIGNILGGPVLLKRALTQERLSGKSDTPGGQSEDLDPEPGTP
jgi:hypothetical protein